MSALFSPYTIKGLTLKNRIAIPPMCQYSATDGIANSWHHTHYASLARGGAALVIVEATAVSPEGRITPNCLGLWNDTQKDALKQVADAIKLNGAIAGVQIGHAGRKASANRPWEGDDHIANGDSKGWDTIAPSAIAFSDTLPKVPAEMTLADIERVKNDFVAAAKRALDAGFEWLELHFAHGYLGQSFFSKHANKRTDNYGGNLDNRSRFLIETVRAIRAIWPDNLPLTARFGVLEFDGEDEAAMQDSISLLKNLKQEGLDFVSVSIGFSTTQANVPWGPAFMAPYAQRIRNEVGIPVSSAWGFGQAQLAEDAVANEHLDIVHVGRAYLANPHWTYETAKKLNIEKADWVLPAPYAHWLERYHA